MLYIHELRHLTSKMAELESVALVRELKQKMSFPLAAQKVSDYCAEFFMSPTDEQQVREASAVLQEIIPPVQELLQEQNPIYEQINLERTSRILQEIQLPLQENGGYIREMLEWQQPALESSIALFNRIPRLRSPEEKSAANQQLKNTFTKLLRNEEFFFRHNDIVNESHVSRMNDLLEGMEKGFLIKVSMEDELKRLSFAVLKQRLPQEEQARLDLLKEKVSQLKRGVDRAYQANLRMVKYGTVLYAYVKWASSG